MQCPNCGNSVESNDLFCGECGTKLTNNTPGTTERAHNSIHAQDLSPTQSKINTERSTSNNDDPRELSHGAKENQTESVEKTDGVPDDQQHTYITRAQHIENEPQRQQDAHDQKGNDQTSDQFKQQSLHILNEMKRFFSTAFRCPDHHISSRDFFSFKTIATLIILGLIITTICLTIATPSEIGYFTSNGTKSPFILRTILFIIIGIAINFFLTYGLVRLLNINISLSKAISDYILINTYSIIFFIIGFLLGAINAPVLALFISSLALLLFFVAPVYLFARYSADHEVRFPVIFAIIIYIIVLLIVMRLFIESIVGPLIGNMTSSFTNNFFRE
ncbi:zinc-ribbon domain-containing protein [Staphylococcus sp. SQ8-PEA]|uniref:Zinc-ribbon domain-containing protein n=1 Tax=Staphylococcus marylandisciuri TaxID=2981529 RepID=A0ABT2QN57_9STAP|nr:zinc-ribbon domain-containing protein [Staphylococcus marylandisciuri]MCU5745414.1 zinc-ribbon domain-containing protein [Staphylococcus marylandisciuri]